MTDHLVVNSDGGNLVKREIGREEREREKVVVLREKGIKSLILCVYVFF